MIKAVKDEGRYGVVQPIVSVLFKEGENIDASAIDELLAKKAQSFKSLAPLLLSPPKVVMKQVAKLSLLLQDRVQTKFDKLEAEMNKACDEIFANLSEEVSESAAGGFLPCIGDGGALDPIAIVKKAVMKKTNKALGLLLEKFKGKLSEKLDEIAKLAWEKVVKSTLSQALKDKVVDLEQGGEAVATVIKSCSTKLSA